MGMTLLLDNTISGVSHLQPIPFAATCTSMMHSLTTKMLAPKLVRSEL